MSKLDYLKIPLYRGDDETIEIQVLDEGGRKVNFKGYTVQADCYNVATGELVWQLSNKTGEFVPSLGEIAITIPHHYTMGATWEELAFDLQLTDPQGKVKTIARGCFTLTPDITGQYGE